MMHPSGLTMARWNWPFKTDAERKLVVAYYKAQARAQIETYGEAPF
jgi:hypothetical protein